MLRCASLAVILFLALAPAGCGDEADPDTGDCQGSVDSLYAADCVLQAGGGQQLSQAEATEACQANQDIALQCDCATAFARLLDCFDQMQAGDDCLTCDGRREALDTCVSGCL